MLVSFFALGLNLGFNYFFVFVMRWGHESLALTTSITASVNFIILFLAMRKFAGDLGTVDLLVLFGKTVIRRSGDGRRLSGGEPFPVRRSGGTRFVIKVIYLGLTIGVASAVYFVAAKLMQVSEARMR